jgi:hypothetical protein
MKANLTFRLLSVGAILFLINHPVQAQSYLTAHAGYGTTNLVVSGTPVDGLINPYIKPIAQYTAGIQYERSISNRLAFITGLQYASRGFGAREDFSVNVFGLELPVGAQIETRIDYVEVPLVAKYNFVEKGVTPYIKAGASTGYAFNGKVTPKINALVTWNLPQININLKNEMYNRVDVSTLVGAGVSIPVDELGSFHFDLTYRHSVNDMFQDNITNIKIKSHGLSAGIGFTMRF